MRYRLLGCPTQVDAEAVARNELRWWVVRREIGLAAGDAAGDAITELYAAIYEVPRERVAEAGRLRGIAAEVRDRGATDDPDGPTGPGAAYWPEVARLLRESYRSLQAALDEAELAPRGQARGPSRRAGLASGRRAGGRRATRRPGRCAPATTSLAASQRRNCVRPSAIVSAQERPTTTFSQGSADRVDDQRCR